MPSASLLPIILSMLLTGLASGVLAGMLGVGGGIIVVPALEFALRYAEVPVEARMHVAVATSLATIIPTSMASARAHYARGAVNLGLARAWGVAVFAGATLGSLLAARASAHWLTAIFGGVALVVGLKMLLPLDHWRLAQRPPQGSAGKLLGVCIGALSAVMGIGGGTLAVPTLTLTGEPIHRAVATSALFGLLISVPGTLVYLLARPAQSVNAYSVGYVSLIGVLLIAPGSWLAAPYGAKLAHAMSKRSLSMAFGGFLLLVATRMIYRTLTAA